MKTITEYLGKVSITCNGLWNVQSKYDRLCLVHDGHFASYISKRPVPTGIALTDEKYWQPVATLKADFSEYLEDVEESLEDMQDTLKQTRLVVQTIEERDALGVEDVSVGCEVYVIDTHETWILETIVESAGDDPDYKTWRLLTDGTEYGLRFRIDEDNYLCISYDKGETWYQLSEVNLNLELEQETGQATDKGMSQKAITDELDKLDEKIDETATTINQTITSNVNTINQSIDDINDDIDDLNYRLDSLLYPVTASLSGTSVYEYTGSAVILSVTYSVTQSGKSPTATTSTVITCAGTTIVNNTSLSGTASTTRTDQGTYTWSLTANIDGATDTASLTQRIIAPMYFGFSSATSVSGLTITSLTKQTVSASAAGTYSLTNNTEGYYMWLCVPDSMTISSVTMDGFAVPMESYSTGSTSIASYRCYRSSNALVAGTYTIVIS